MSRRGRHLSSKGTPKEVAMLEVVVVEKRRRQRWLTTMASSFAISTSNIGNVKTVNKNKLLPSTRRHTTCKDMAAGRKPDTQEDFPNLCEEVFHRYGNTQKLWFLCLCSLHSYCRRFESRPMVILNVESPLKKCCATLHWISY